MYNTNPTMMPYIPNLYQNPGHLNQFNHPQPNPMGNSVPFRGGFRGGRGRGRGNFSNLSQQTRRQREDDSFEAENPKKQVKNNKTNTNNGPSQRGNQNSNARPVDDTYDLYIGHWDDILTNSASKAQFKKTTSYFSKKSKFFSTSSSNFPITPETFSGTKIKNVFLKFDSKWFETDLLLSKAMSDWGKMGDTYVDMVSAVDNQVQKVITCARPTGNFFFVLGQGDPQAAVAGYAIHHCHPIIQLYAKGHRPSLADVEDDAKDIKKAKIFANIIIDVARRFYYVSTNTSPVKDVLQD